MTPRVGGWASLAGLETKCWANCCLRAGKRGPCLLGDRRDRNLTAQLCRQLGRMGMDSDLTGNDGHRQLCVQIISR